MSKTAKQKREEYRDRQIELLGIDGWRKQLCEKHLQYLKRKFDKFIEMYGGKCACCGESEPGFLTLEHKNGTGGDIRKSKNTNNNQGEYIEACKEYRPDKYEILCYNCNLAKRRLGYCPHTKK